MPTPDATRLVLRITFRTGTYHGSVAPESDAADWPPQFDRVFSAMVASSGARGIPADERAALEWLERQTPPAMRAMTATPAGLMLSFVPTNGDSKPITDGARGKAFDARVMEGLPETHHAADIDLLRG